MGKSELLWTPSAQAIEESPMHHFMLWCADRHGKVFENHEAFHQWSIEERGAFWSAVWDYCAIIGEKGERSLIHGDDMLAARFFPDAKLNFAQNLLRDDVNMHTDALVFRGEDKVETRITHRELRQMVSRLQQALRRQGLGSGDHVAAMMPNLPETIAFMLAAASLGIVWSSCSPDFGEQGVLDRFGQIAPKLFIACDGYWYAGKRQDIGAKLVAIQAALNVPMVIVPYAGAGEALLSRLPGAQSFEQFMADFQPKAIDYEALAFNHPLYILFSSGTTGIPKCIVHGAGGTLLQHVKEQRFHCGIKPGDRLFYFTTCGWMMWNWLASGLASGAVLCLYDGSPFHPDGNILFDFAEKEKFAVFGTSAKYIDAVRKAGLVPAKTHDLSRLRLITSTGSPLSPEGFHFVYQGIKADVHLASISGGTDIVSCFVLGNPVKPVYSGEIQGAGLGLAVNVWDDNGNPVRGEKGELVCTRAFPSMPIMFWNDDDGAKYKAAYFERFDNIWCHGDFAEWTENGGLIIHGRSDATLNPGGVRIGTAEIYNQVEKLDEVAEALCIGQDYDGDVRVVLFVRLKAGHQLDEALKTRIKSQIRAGASPRHVPAVIIAVEDIPRTKSGKIVELAVREVVHGRPVKNKEALANPQALELYAHLEELK